MLISIPAHLVVHLSSGYLQWAQSHWQELPERCLVPSFLLLLKVIRRNTGFSHDNIKQSPLPWSAGRFKLWKCHFFVGRRHWVVTEVVFSLYAAMCGEAQGLLCLKHWTPLQRPGHYQTGTEHVFQGTSISPDFWEMSVGCHQTWLPTRLAGIELQRSGDTCKEICNVLSAVPVLTCVAKRIMENS